MKVDGFPMSEVNNVTPSSDLLSRFEPGSVVRAKVLEVSSDILKLKLFDGSTISAKSMIPLDVKRGQLVDFIVKEKSGNQLFLETIRGKNSIDNSGVLAKELLQIGIKPDDKSMSIAKEIKGNNLQLDKQIFDKVSGFLDKFKGISLDKVTYLLSKNMELTEKNISSLNKMVEGKMSIGSTINEIIKSLDNIKDEDILNIHKNGHDIENFGKDTKGSGKGQTLNNISNNMSNKSDSTSGDVPANLFKTGKGIGQDQQKDISKLGENNLISKGENAGIKKFENPFNKLDTKLQNIKDILKYNSESDIKSKSVNNSSDTIKESTIMERINKSHTNTQEAFSIEDKKDMLHKNIIKTIDSNGHSEELKAHERDGEASKDHETLKDIKENIKRSLKDIFIKVSEDTKGEDLQIKNLYKNINDKLDVLKTAIENLNPPNKEDILNNIESVKEGMRFLNDINNHSTYIQIPLNIFNKNTTGELYILKKDGGKKRIDPQNATVFLSLDTINLGQVDSLISVNKKNISLNLSVQKEEIISFIKENYTDIYHRLKEKGYKLIDIKYKITGEKPNVLNIEKIINKEYFKENMSIDYKI